MQWQEDSMSSVLDVLKRLRGREAQVGELKEKIRMRRDAATSVTAQYGAAPPGGGSGDRMSDYVAQIDELSRKIADITCLWQAEMAYCVGLCDAYDGVERMLIYNYYGKGWTLRAVASAGGYSEGYCRKAKGRLDASLSEAEAEPHRLPDWYERKREELE